MNGYHVDVARREVDRLRRALAAGEPVGIEFADAVDVLRDAVEQAKRACPFTADWLDLIAAPRLDEHGR